jgi:hypothetical protein
MSPESRKKIQLVLAAGIAIAALRTGYILYERHQDNAAPVKQEAGPLQADYYVTPRKLHAYDLKSAHELTQQPVWVKEGYRYTYYPYNSARRRSDFAHEAGTLGPIERLEIKDVVTDITPGAPDQKQVMAVFEKDGKGYAFPIGSVQGSDFRIYADEMLFIQDPKDLYKHWPPEVWDAINKHEVKPGMNQLQASFAVGMGSPNNLHDASNRTINYPNGGKPVTVTFQDDRAVSVNQGS